MKHRYSRCNKKLMQVLRDMRETAHITQRDLSAKLRRDKNFVQVTESGERSLAVCEFIDYARALGAQPAEVLQRVIDEVEIEKERRRRS